MHKSSILGAALISLAPAALADFQIYAATDNYPIDMGPGGISNDSGYIFVASEPSCDDINAVPLIGGNDDASNSGVRCEGEGCNDAGESTIDTFEWNTDMGHFTIYSPGYGVIPADGSDSPADCYGDTGDDFSCSFGVGDSFTGSRLFICTGDLTI